MASSLRGSRASHGATAHCKERMASRGFSARDIRFIIDHGLPCGEDEATRTYRVPLSPFSVLRRDERLERLGGSVVVVDRRTRKAVTVFYRYLDDIGLRARGLE